MQPIDSLRETEESHSMIEKGKGKGGMGLEEVDFDSFDGDVDEGEQRLEGWNVTSEDLILGDVRTILDVAHEPDNNDDNQVTTPLMRSLGELCSSIEYNDKSVIDARSMDSIPEDTDFTGGGNLIMSPAGSEDISSGSGLLLYRGQSPVRVHIQDLESQLLLQQHLPYL